MFANVYVNRRVLVTGHTGFKGSWLSLWLLHLGAEVGGFSIDVPSMPANFEVLGLKSRIRHYQGDVRNREMLAAAIDDFRPDIVFHLAAQSLVRKSYADPVATFETNAMGTLNLLECLRTRPWVHVVVLITSDKAYRNSEWYWGYREDDMLGGKDPYSGSKGAAELISYSYYHSFFKDSDTRMATTRAGNVIGGGDWAVDRIVPDCMRAWSEGQTVTVRNPVATRPWQHVLEPLSGYLVLGQHLWECNTFAVGESFNFGPDSSVNQTVEELLEAMILRWPEHRWEAPENISGAHEATLLKLCCDKALHHLDWHAVLRFSETVEFTVDWYKSYYSGRKDMFDFSLAQINRYSDLAKERRVIWSN